MNLLAILLEYLDFIIHFYDTTTSPLILRIHHINQGMPPYAPTGNPRDFDDEPQYLDEWIEADDIIRVLGQSALGLLSKAMHDYLRAFVMREGDMKKEEGEKSKEKGDWFKRFGASLGAIPTFSWDRSPASYAQLEQINLCRNNFMHDAEIGRIRIRQDKEHFRRYPRSAFADASEVQYYEASGIENDDEPWTLNVTRESLVKHVELVRQFCVYVEQHRTVF